METDFVFLHIKLYSSFHKVLQIPTSVVPLYALKPYKWLLFLGFVIYGDSNPGFITLFEDQNDKIPDQVLNSNTLQHYNVYYIPSGKCSLNFLEKYHCIAY